MEKEKIRINQIYLLMRMELFIDEVYTSNPQTAIDYWDFTFEDDDWQGKQSMQVKAFGLI